MNLTAMAFGYVPARIIHAAVRLGVVDVLAGGPLPPEKLYALAGTPQPRERPDAADGLARLVRALTVLGLVEQLEDGRIALTDRAGPLRADHPASIRAGVLLAADPASWQAWGALPEAVTEGGSGFEHAHGRPLFDFLAGEPELSRVFGAAMGETSAAAAAALPRAFDFGPARTVVDVGGGRGTVLAAILAAAPGPHGVLFDSVAGAAQAPATLGRAVPPDRWTVRTGDFFAGVPAGDVLILKGILHDWDDVHCGRLLRRCRDALAPGGRLLVVEPVVPDEPGGHDAWGPVYGDIAMLVYTGGRERTRDEYARLLAASGFTLENVGPTLSDTSARLLVAR